MGKMGGNWKSITVIIILSSVFGRMYLKRGSRHKTGNKYTRVTDIKWIENKVKLMKTTKIEKGF